MADDTLNARYTLGEEVANALTHGFGIVLSVIGLVVLLLAATAFGGTLRFASCAMYGATLIAVYTTSTLYHSATRADAKQRLQTLDHIAIFLLIAGTYTPFMLIALRGAWGWSLFGVVWTLALIGAIVELTTLRRYRGAMIALYVSMGWIGLVALKPLIAALPTPGLWLLFGGGVSYTAGVAFYKWRTLRYHHAIWHLFVLGGSVLQFLSVLWYVLPKT